MYHERSKDNHPSPASIRRRISNGLSPLIPLFHQHDFPFILTYSPAAVSTPSYFLTPAIPLHISRSHMKSSYLLQNVEIIRQHNHFQHLCISVSSYKIYLIDQFLPVEECGAFFRVEWRWILVWKIVWDGIDCGMYRLAEQVDENLWVQEIGIPSRRIYEKSWGNDIEGIAVNGNAKGHGYACG